MKDYSVPYKLVQSYQNKFLVPSLYLYLRHKAATVNTVVHKKGVAIPLLTGQMIFSSRKIAMDLGLTGKNHMKVIAALDLLIKDKYIFDIDSVQRQYRIVSIYKRVLKDNQDTLVPSEYSNETEAVHEQDSNSLVTKPFTPPQLPYCVKNDNLDQLIVYSKDDMKLNEIGEKLNLHPKVVSQFLVNIYDYLSNSPDKKYINLVSTIRVWTTRETERSGKVFDKFPKELTQQEIDDYWRRETGNP